MPAQWLGALGMQAAGNAINAGMGIALGAYNDQRQLKQQKKLNQLENERAMDLWNRTNYWAQVEQLKKAGLNPGLLYGMGGGGGATMGHGGQAAPVGGGEMGLMKGGTELALLKAQIENIKADTENKKADTTKTAGVDTTEAETRIASLTQGIKNQKAQEALIGIQDSILRNELWEKYESQDARMDMFTYETKKALYEAEIAMAQAGVDTATIKAKIDILKAQAISQVLTNGLIKAQTTQTQQLTEQSKAQIGKWAEEIMQGWIGLDQKQQEIRLEAIQMKIDQLYPRLIGNNTQGFHHDKSEVREAIDKIMKWKGGKIN